MNWPSKQTFRELPKALGIFNEYKDFLSGVFVLLAALATYLQNTPIWLHLVIVAALFTLGAWYLLQRWLMRNQRLHLTGRWQALAWAHYRQRLAEAMTRSSAAGESIKFDFVTFCAGEFERKLHGEFYHELQYLKASKPNLDLLIFDIEYLDELEKGINFGASTYSLVRLGSFYETEQWGNTPNKIAQLLDRLESRTKAIPIRWGYNGIIFKLEPKTKLALSNAGIDVDQTSFDLNALVSDQSRLRQYLATNDDVNVVALDWYLPTMGLLAWSLELEQPHLLLDQQFIKVTAMLAALAKLMAKECPLYDDPLQLAHRVRGPGSFVVIGGGNWLCVDDTDPPPLPVKLGDKSGYMLWCECVGLLAPEKSKPTTHWREDAKVLLEWVTTGGADEAVLKGISPYNGTESLILGGHELTVRQLPPEKHSAYADRKRWQDAWSEWKRQLEARP